jgi:hypothetical protein
VLSACSTQKRDVAGFSECDNHPQNYKVPCPEDNSLHFNQCQGLIASSFILSDITCPMFKKFNSFIHFHSADHIQGHQTCLI